MRILLTHKDFESMFILQVGEYFTFMFISFASTVHRQVLVNNGGRLMRNSFSCDATWQEHKLICYVLTTVSLSLPRRPPHLCHRPHSPHPRRPRPAPAPTQEGPGLPGQPSANPFSNALLTAPKITSSSVWLPSTLTKMSAPAWRTKTGSSTARAVGNTGIGI